MAGETYRYNVVIGIDVETGGVGAGSRALEENLNRTQRKTKEHVEKIQKTLDMVDVKKIEDATARIPAAVSKAATAASTNQITIANTTATRSYSNSRPCT